MDTPERSKIGTTQISKFEDSPIFNFINNLSPIQPVKSAHEVQVFQSLSFASISSVFSSPHINLQKESRFLSRHSYSDSSQIDTCYDNFDGSSPSVAPENYKIECSLNKAIIDLPEENLSQTTKPTLSIQYECDSPNHNTKPNYGIEIELKVDNCKTQGALQNEHHQITLNNDEADASDWESLISDNAENLLIVDSLTESEKEKDNYHSSTLMLSELKPSLQNGVVEEHAIDHTPQILSNTFQNQIVLNDTNKEAKESDSGISTDCKVESQQQRGMRRRCLTFDLSKAFMKNSKFNFDNMKSTASRQGSSPSACALPGIGLHLNTLATTPNDRIFISPMTPVPSIRAGNKSLNKLLNVKMDQCPTGSEAQDIEVAHSNTFKESEFGHEENINQSSPRKKRKLESGGESDVCKRCNCKKSKCLKLYCECFAAGIYCVEPCSCQECFNKPIHEETVLTTRKLIESRNPLAFAPKVVRASEPADVMMEETYKTPASARHKRGCNCKKSSCLKKYCECFQGGVGCSPSCRCEGCKNAFGRKDADENEHAEGAIDACDIKQDKTHDQQNAVVTQSEDHTSESLLTITPALEISRHFIKPPFLSSRKLPRSSTLSRELKNCEFPIQQNVGNHFKPAEEKDSTEIVRGDSSPNNGVKNISPNGKRVSPPCRALEMSPNRKGGRKLILQAIPSFPSLGNDVENDNVMHQSSSSVSSLALN